MAKLKDEKEMLKKAIRVGMQYAENRGVVKFDETDSANQKIEYLYRLLVHDKQIVPLPPDKVSMIRIKHKLALWASKLKKV